MKHVTEFRNPEIARALIKKINQESHSPIQLMEFCGGHTSSIFRYGIRQAMPGTVNMVSGPGCPVCVTTTGDIDKAIALAQKPDTIITTFGDLMRVPGSYSSLERVKATGCDVRIVYSTMDALKIAEANSTQNVIFLGIGFETTAPTIAASILQALQKKVKNYYIFSMHKVCPPVIRTLLDSGEVNIQGFICPGHVSAITGSHAWEFIAKEYMIPCVVTGFEALDILQSVDMLIAQINEDRSEVEIAYRRSVCYEGNQSALKLMDMVFEPCGADWRGMGEIPDSGLKLRSTYRDFDAELTFPVTLEPVQEPKGCICGEILRGIKTPLLCPLFNQVCTPQNPVGPCMVSSEGTCSIYYLHEVHNE